MDSVKAARKFLSTLKGSLERRHEYTGTDMVTAIGVLQRVLEIADAADKQGHVFTPVEISDIGEQGLALMKEGYARSPV